MPHLIQPYLFFSGRCEEAIEFYRTALDAELVMLMRFNENPEPDQSQGCAGGSVPGEKIMHASLRIGEATVMLSDGCDDGQPNFEGFSLALTVDDLADADRFFAALAEGGEVTMPLARTFWSPRFGMVTDRFGVCWMISLPPVEA